jgi:hypothetical protein
MRAERNPGHSKRFAVLVNPGSALADREIAGRG